MARLTIKTLCRFSGRLGSYVLLMLFVPCNVLAMPPGEAIIAAKQGVGVLLGGSSDESIRMLGLSGRQDISAATVGEGFQVFVLDPGLLQSNAQSQDFRQAIKPTNSWEFVIEGSENAKAVMKIDNVEGKFTAVSIGSSGMARQLARIAEVWPTSSNYSHKIVRIYQAKSDFVELSQGDILLGFIPLISARIAMGLAIQDFDPFDLRTSSETLTSVRSVLGNTPQGGGAK